MCVEAGDDRGPWDGGQDLGWVLCVLRFEDGQDCSRFCLVEDGDVHLLLTSPFHIGIRYGPLTQTACNMRGNAGRALYNLSIVCEPDTRMGEAKGEKEKGYCGFPLGAPRAGHPCAGARPPGLVGD